MSSPTQRSLAYLRAQNFYCSITEHWNHFAKIRQDLWGFCDILAIRGHGEIIAVQTTDATNVSHRRAKIEGLATFPLVVASGIQVEIHGWGKDKKQMEPRIVIPTLPAVSVREPS